ncbi:HK97 gp10 family phage protein, partial [Staphylococcus aureus]|nr:HK97 gp10 family phage protein [Staphylococcus aureus]
HVMSARDSNIEGGAALDALLKTLPAKIEKNNMRNALREGATVYLQEIKATIPTDSGQLRKSARITTRSGRGGVSASVKVGNLV